METLQISTSLNDKRLICIKWEIVYGTGNIRVPICETSFAKSIHNIKIFTSILRDILNKIQYAYIFDTREYTAVSCGKLISDSTGLTIVNGSHKYIIPTTHMVKVLWDLVEISNIDTLDMYHIKFTHNGKKDGNVQMHILVSDLHHNVVFSMSNVLFEIDVLNEAKQYYDKQLQYQYHCVATDQHGISFDIINTRVIMEYCGEDHNSDLSQRIELAHHQLAPLFDF